LHDGPANENTSGLLDWGTDAMKNLNDAVMPLIRTALG
jgi:hypothetical protein